MTQTVCLRPSGISDRMNRSASSKRSKSTRRRGSSRSQHSPSHHRTDAGLSPRRVSKPVKARVRYVSDVPSVAGECCLSKAQQPFRRASRQSRSKKAPPCGPRGRTGLSMRCRPRRGTPSSTDVCLTHPLNLPPGLRREKPRRVTRATGPGSKESSSMKRKPSLRKSFQIMNSCSDALVPRRLRVPPPLKPPLLLRARSPLRSGAAPRRRRPSAPP